MSEQARVLTAIVYVILLSGHALAEAQGRKEIVVGAADLAPPELRVDWPVPGKRWLRRDAQDWGSRSGALLTGWPAGEEAGEFSTKKSLAPAMPQKVG